MTLYRRPGSQEWSIDFVQGGKRHRARSGTTDKRKAAMLQDKMRGEAWQRARLPDTVPHTIGELVGHWESLNHARELKRERYVLNTLASHYGHARTLLDVGNLSDYVPHLRATMSASSVNRHLHAIRALGKIGQRLGWLPGPWLLEPMAAAPVAPRWVTKEQAATLLAALWPHARAMAEFALETGLRYGNIAGLEWSWVDTIGGTVSVPALRAKARKPITIPLSQRARTILEEQRQRHTMYVFTNHRGEAPVLSLKTHWRKVTARLGLTGLRFHDLRHSWASHHVLAGTPSQVVKELGGWASMSMVDRYTHLNVDDLRRYV